MRWDSIEKVCRIDIDYAKPKGKLGSKWAKDAEKWTLQQLAALQADPFHGAAGETPAASRPAGLFTQTGNTFRRLARLAGKEGGVAWEAYAVALKSSAHFWDTWGECTERGCGMKEFPWRD